VFGWVCVCVGVSPTLHEMVIFCRWVDDDHSCRAETHTYTHIYTHNKQAAFLLLWSLTFTRLLPPNTAPATISPPSFLAIGYAILLNLHWVSQVRAGLYIIYMCVYVYVCVYVLMQSIYIFCRRIAGG
jgi:hypothetical protein